MMRSRARHAGFITLVAMVFALVATGSGAGFSPVPAVSASLTMTSDAGDFIGQGQDWDYSTADATFDTFGDALSFDGNAIRIRVRTANVSDYWDLDFQAPQGQTLTTGTTYVGAIRGIRTTPVAEPRMEVIGNHRGCNTLTGAFTIIDIAYGPYGYLQRAHVTFEQHCEGAEPALRGEVLVEAPPAPPPVTLDVAIDDIATTHRREPFVTVSGILTCSHTFDGGVGVQLSQTTKKGLAQSAPTVANATACSPSSPGTWSARVFSQTAVNFTQGAATAEASASMLDRFYSEYLFESTILVREFATETVDVRNDPMP
jgi:hypothetical protein